MQSNLFTSSPSVQSSRILYTSSPFARSSLLHLQEVGSLTAIRPHTSKREKLQSYLCFMVEDGEGELVYEGKKYELRSGDVVFIDCRKAYSHSTGMNLNEELWSLQWVHFSARTWALSTVSIKNVAASQYSRRASCNLTTTSWTNCTLSHLPQIMSGTCGSMRSCPLS